MLSTLLAYKQLPDEVTEQMAQLFRWLLWIVEVGLIGRLIWVGGRAGWELYRPPPGPPPAPGAVVRAMVAWILASVAWPLAASLLMNLAF
ncbi:hypothetical protein OG225_40385 (plasmid) [Nocardia sp. NBC_01377]|uniref:hypothetical protein n=1 Tax=Nocardia sp. NBC_01377 TaxID=2903595 RepID=UPI002F907111